MLKRTEQIHRPAFSEDIAFFDKVFTRATSICPAKNLFNESKVFLLNL